MNIGAVLQQDPDCEPLTPSSNLEEYAKTVKTYTLKPIAHESHKLYKTEQNYPAQERELLAIIHALNYFRGYVEGSSILVGTDHKSLKYFKFQKEVNCRLEKFVDERELFNIHIISRPGSEQMAADALSRKPDCASDPDPPEVAESLFSLKLGSCRRRSLRTTPTIEDLDRKNSVLKDNELYRLWKDQPDLKVITDLDRAIKLAQETDGRLGHCNARDTSFQLKTEC
ncbi:hypothetical protein MJO28_013896 [Puccinia striiformis f. sp. tritici]|uniref:Uncharacterized protein n=1 Tax=Puccinia striiformis f. sp. tritici TaxID=168172 RepID=A0ACC0DXS7_9BASI|nr:hypothetical protein MJO28_013896 [Puccinia striiformis f. sp. tritici]KAI7941666.1 hypothetical protein MJO29_013740 [Puccinia striiformis f. sp. tritici]